MIEALLWNVCRAICSRAASVAGSNRKAYRTGKLFIVENPFRKKQISSEITYASLAI
jgi:hypothetical protein